MRKRMIFAAAGLVFFAFVVSQASVQAQTPCGVVKSCPTPQPTDAPTPQPTPGPSSTATPSPEATTGPHATLPPLPGQTASPTPKATPTPTVTPSGTPGFDGLTSSTLPSDLQKGFDLSVPDIPRTLPNNSAKLVSLLEPLTQLGLPLDQVLAAGMGHF